MRSREESVLAGHERRRLPNELFKSDFVHDGRTTQVGRSKDPFELIVRHSERLTVCFRDVGNEGVLFRLFEGNGYRDLIAGMIHRGVDDDPRAGLFRHSE